MMKEKCKKGVEIIVESVNFIIITYALSSVSMSLRSSWVYILFFASNVWLISMYCNTINKYSNFDLDKSFINQYKHNNSCLIAALRRLAGKC